MSVIIIGLFLIIILFSFFKTISYAESGFLFDAKDVRIKEGSFVEIAGTINTDFEDTDLKIEIIDENGHHYDFVPVKTDISGTAEVKLRLPENVKLGSYSIVLKDNQNVAISYSQEFSVIIPNIDLQLQNIKLGCSTDELLQGTCFSKIGEQSGGCLIATATYGSELAPQVQFLREIRDNTVLSTQSGTSFMSAFNTFYYFFSPTIADLERQNPAFKEAVKITITPLLTSLSLLQYADIDSEDEMLGYGIGIILFNIGMYFVAPILIILKLKPDDRKKII